jgi:hypothetical protein
MTDDYTAFRAEVLAKAASARAQSRKLRAEAIRLARQVADTEEIAAEILKRLAALHPHLARRLLAMSEAAASHAAHERKWAADQVSAERAHPPHRG